jgi:excisionase family DNA binding protein
MDSSLLSTSEVARLLGCSRQHVVDLCNQGRLPSTTVGSHRRIRRSDLESFVRDRSHGSLRPEQLRSLWIGRAVAGKLAQEPSRVLAIGRENLVRLRAIHRRSGPWLDLWEAKNSPFAGVLTQDEVTGIVGAFQASWRRRESGPA